jgi:3-hydroxyisobutyrate dehydrogenase-like beta-hydroxyacid dehydrogenase
MVATNSSQAMNVAFAGLGAMGFGMACHLISLGHQVLGFDVYEPSLSKFHTAGGQTTASPREAAQAAAFFICMVTNAQQAESVLFDSATGAVQGKWEHQRLLTEDRCNNLTLPASSS